jgi:hypothetical protein
MKNWIMIVTITKEVKGKNNNGIYFCTYFSDGEQAEVKSGSSSLMVR